MPDGLDAIFQETAEVLQEGDEEVEDYERRRRSRDRSVIAYLVVGSFVVLIGAVTVTVLWSDWTKTKEPAEFLMSMLSSVLLPVVTLVIGHYFGEKAASGD